MERGDLAKGMTLCVPCVPIVRQASMYNVVRAVLPGCSDRLVVYLVSDKMSAWIGVCNQVGSDSLPCCGLRCKIIEIGCL